MARADLLPDVWRNNQSWTKPAPTMALPTVAESPADDVHRQVVGDVSGAAERSGGGYNPPNYSTGPKRTGDARADWLALTSGLPPSLESIGKIFPTFSEWYPGSSFEKADIRGPWGSGWVDTIGNLDDPYQQPHWQWLQGTNNNTGVGGGGLRSAYSPQFNDPLTKQYERLLQSQTALYEGQQADMAEEAARKKSVRADTDAAVKRLMDFINKRVDELGQPAYTDSEANVIKTRLLDPLEADRDASQKRALNNIGSRGMDPSSGIAQQLFQDVNREYDKTRSRAHGDIAYEQIQEERSRDQEAQDLLKYLAQLPGAAARSDLDFVNYLDELVSRPGEKALTSSALLSDLPVQRTQLALQALGLGGSPISAVPGTLSLLNNSATNRIYNNQSMTDFWKNIGLSF